MEFSEAIKRPFQHIGKTILLSVLLLVPFVNIITAWFSYGYLLETARHLWGRKPGLPEWTDWGNLWVNGLLALIISLIYAIPAIVLIALSATVHWILFAIAVIYEIVLVFVLPAALLSYAQNYEFAAAFRCKEVLAKAFRGSFVLPVILGVIWAIVLTIPIVIPILGYLWMLILGAGAATLTFWLLVADAY